jgi:hypothetical protein
MSEIEKEFRKREDFLYRNGWLGCFVCFAIFTAFITIDVGLIDDDIGGPFTILYCVFSALFGVYITWQFYVLYNLMKTKHHYEFLENKTSMWWTYFTAIFPLCLKIYFHLFGRI